MLRISSHLTPPNTWLQINWTAWIGLELFCGLAYMVGELELICLVGSTLLHNIYVALLFVDRCEISHSWEHCDVFALCHTITRSLRSLAGVPIVTSLSMVRKEKITPVSRYWHECEHVSIMWSRLSVMQPEVLCLVWEVGSSNIIVIPGSLRGGRGGGGRCVCLLSSFLLFRTRNVRYWMVFWCILSMVLDAHMW